MLIFAIIFLVISIIAGFFIWCIPVGNEATVILKEIFGTYMLVSIFCFIYHFWERRFGDDMKMIDKG